MSTLFCRHNRFTADCPICSKGTVLDRSRGSAARPRATARPGTKAKPRAGAATSVRTVAGPYVSVGPYERDDGTAYDVRLERVPGGLRLAEWSAGQMARRAPVLAAADVAPMLIDARERAVLRGRDLEPLERALREPAVGDAGAEALNPRRAGRSGEQAGVEPAGVQGTGDGRAGVHGASPGRAGELREELRVEALAGDTLRIGRWILRPNHGWELQQAPVMLPAARFAEALRDAARRGLLARG